MLAEKSNFQLLKMSNVYQSELRLDRNPSFWENITEKQKEFLLKKGDSILTLTGTVGKRDYGYSVLIQEDNKYLLNQRLVLLREIKGKSASGFINYILSNEIFLFFFFGESKGGTGNQTNVSTEDVKNIRVKFPSLPEQQKIASFLTTVDEKHQALKKKKSLLDQYKKGVMQKIFSQELRFKDDDGNEFPEWEVKKLGEIAKITTGSSNRQDSNLDGQFTFFDRSQDIRTSDRYLFDKEAIIVPGEGQEFIPKYFKGKFDLHQRTYAIMDFDEIDGKFLFYSISFNSNHLNSHAVGSTVKSLRLPMFETMPIMIPSLSEQTKISNFLSSIDEKIQLVQGQVEKMEVWKKGLLQKMFV
jgi:type I restriction enzyme S subunit